MVHGRAISNANDRSLFLSNCWQLWLDHLYDAVDDDVDDEAFSFDLDDQTAPHYPLTISSSEAFMNFNPDANPDILTANGYGSAYSELLTFVRGYPHRADRVLLPEMLVDEATTKAQPANWLRPMFDLLWNAFGQPGSPNYDTEGRYLQR